MYCRKKGFYFRARVGRNIPAVFHTRTIILCKQRRQQNVQTPPILSLPGHDKKLCPSCGDEDCQWQHSHRLQKFYVISLVSMERYLAESSQRNV